MGLFVRINGQEIELLENKQVIFIQDNLVQNDNWVLNTFFPNKRTFENESEVDIGKLESTEFLAPFVSANAKARQIGGSTKMETFKVPAAYLKPSREITPENVKDEFYATLLRQMNVLTDSASLARTYTQAEKVKICQMYNALYNQKAIDNRKTLMALDVLTKGHTEYQDEDFPYIKVDYRRDSRLSRTVLTLWGESTADVVGDMQTALDTMFEVSGVQPTMLLSTSKAYNAALKNKTFQDRFVKADGSNQPNNTLLPTLLRSVKPVLKGHLDGMAWYVYDAQHKLLSNTAQHYIDPNMLYFIGDTDGFDAQCQIKHLDVMGVPLSYYHYVDESKNPSAIQQICDSAPLIAPSNPNAVLALKVF